METSRLKVLFISSGNLKLKQNPIVINQANSLENQGVNVLHFFVKGKGFWGYLKNIFSIKRLIKKEKFDIIHAHYSFCGFLATIATRKPVITSLMGSDIKHNKLLNLVIFIFYKFFWRATIVKTRKMKEELRLKNAIIIPNGVDLKAFFPIARDEARKKLNLSLNDFIILFVGDISRYEKNFSLAERAYNIVSQEFQKVKLLAIYNTDPALITYYLNSANILLMTSRWEGSPNVVKEAMAVNLPIIATDVGDVKELIGNTEGCYLTAWNEEEIAEKLRFFITNKINHTQGREFIKKISSEVIASIIITLYKKIKK